MTVLRNGQVTGGIEGDVAELDTTPGRTLRVKPTGSNNADGLKWSTAKQTIQAAVNASQPGDEILVFPGPYNEAVVIPPSKSNITIRALFADGAGRGAVFIKPSGATALPMTVLADDVTLVNIGCEGKSTADYAIRVGAVVADLTPYPEVEDIARFRAYGCKFEGAAVAVRFAGCGDVMLRDCEVAWCVTGVDAVGGIESYPTQVFVEDTRFHNVSGTHVGDGASGKFQNIHLLRNVHDNADDGTEPTKYLDLTDSGTTGLVTGCTFAFATNEADVLAIAADVVWGPNGTEAGWSTARPS